MFIGHVAVGFAAKRAAPQTSLGLLVAAPLFADLLWPIFLLLGWEALTTRPRDGVGHWAFAAFVALVLVIYAANASSPAPPSESAVAWVTLSLWLLPLWAAWFDRHRDPVSPPR